MINIYDATDEHKREIIEIENEDLAYRKRWQKTGIKDLVLIRQTNKFPTNGIVHPIDIDEETQEQTSNWTLNAANLSGKKYIIVEPFKEQINNPNLSNIHELDTWFTGEVILSKRSTVLMPEETYKTMCEEDPKFKAQAKKLNISLYRGDQDLALKMLMYNNNYISLGLDENGFVPIDEYGDMLQYIDELKKAQESSAIELQNQGRNVTYGRTHNYYENENANSDDTPSIEQQSEAENTSEERIQEQDSIMITGLTSAVEGNLELNEECYATTAIGKVRKNQEDAVALIKDKDIPQFKMMVIADGMGGEKRGEVASHIIVTKLKEWFESLSSEEKESYYNEVSNIEETLKNKIQEISFQIEWDLYGLGGATLVCALIGKNDTIVANVGDSRGYIIKNGKLQQITTDDSAVQKEFEKGKIPFKDAMRFHKNSAELTQAVGMGRIEYVHTKIMSNNDYDMLLLFSDGVTDCLSEDDIAVICSTTNRKEVAKMIVQKANEHDSIGPEVLYGDYVDFIPYIPGGKDNTTVAVFEQKRDDKEER